jgi:hypothetical protein
LTYDVTEATLADHPDGGRGADVVPIVSVAHSDDAPLADSVDPESMPGDADARAYSRRDETCDTIK